MLNRVRATKSFHRSTIDHSCYDSCWYILNYFVGMLWKQSNPRLRSEQTCHNLHYVALHVRTIVYY